MPARNLPVLVRSALLLPPLLLWELLSLGIEHWTAYQLHCASHETRRLAASFLALQLVINLELARPSTAWLESPTHCPPQFEMTGLPFVRQMGG